MTRFRIKIAYSEDDRGYIAVARDLPGCSAFGQTEDEAEKEIKIAIQLWVAEAHKEGREIPVLLQEEARTDRAAQPEPTDRTDQTVKPGELAGKAGQAGQIETTKKTEQTEPVSQAGQLVKPDQAGKADQTDQQEPVSQEDQAGKADLTDSERPVRELEVELDQIILESWWPNQYEYLWVAAILLFGIGDIITTWWAIQNGAEEANPFLHYIVHGNFGLFIMVKGMLLGAAYLYAQVALVDNGHDARFMPCVFILAGVYLIVNNYLVTRDLIEAGAAIGYHGGFG